MFAYWELILELLRGQYPFALKYLENYIPVVDMSFYVCENI